MLKKNGFIISIYTVMLAAVLLIFVINSIRTTDHQKKYQDIKAISFTDGWTDETGNLVSTAVLNSAKDHPVGHPFTITKQLPDDMSLDHTLIFRSSGLHFCVWIEDTTLYTYGMESIHIFGNSPGTGQHIITVPAKFAGEKINITFFTSYNADYERLADMYIGNGVQMLREQMSQNMFGIIVCMILISIGILYILLDFPISRSVYPDHSLRYLGIFSVVVGTWSAIETRVPSLFIQNAQALSCFSLMLLSLVAIPMGLFLSASFKIRYPRLLHIGYVLSVIGFAVCLILYLSSIADYSQTLIISQMTIMYFLIVTIFNIAANLRRKQCNGIEKWLIVISITVMSACVIIDLAASKVSYRTDNSRFTRIGMAVVVICFGMVTCLQTIKKFKKASQLELISQLAYKDGLTGIGNRTAFNERVAAFSAKQEESLHLTVVMFDVNNLKHANDQYGHQQGDILIQGASDTIGAAFSEIGEVYRIGGDEFVVLVVGIAKPEPIERALEYLGLEIEKFNQSGLCAVPLSIAYGYAYSHTQPDTVDKLIHTADDRMYENKRKMKAEAAAKQTQAAAV